MNWYYQYKNAQHKELYVVTKIIQNKKGNYIEEIFFKGSKHECENWLFKYIHENHAYSVHMALKEQGWNIIPYHIQQAREKSKKHDQYFQEPDVMNPTQLQNAYNQILDQFNQNIITRDEMQLLMQNLAKNKNKYTFSDVPFNKNWPYHIDNPNLPDPKTMNEISFTSFDKIDISLLYNQSDAIEQMFPNATPFGSGGFGLVYDLHDGRVLKLTVHFSEIEVATIFKNKPNPYIADIYDIVIIEQEKKAYNTVWGIISEKLIIPSSQEQEMIGDFLGIMTRSLNQKLLNDIIQNKNPLQVFQSIDNNAQDKDKDKDKYKYIYNYKQLLINRYEKYSQINVNHIDFVIKQIAFLIIGLLQLGLKPNADPKGRNVGWKTKGNLAYLDLGFLNENS